MNSSLEKLAERVQVIQSNYSPLKNIDQKLFGRHGEDNLESLLEAHSRDLSTENQIRLRSEFFSWGPLDPLIQRTDIFEIIVNSPDHIFVETANGLKQLEDRFLSPLTFRNFIQRICQKSGAQYTVEQPFANGSLHNFRIHLVGPPISEGFQLTLRKHLSKSIDLESYVTADIMTQQQHDTLQTLVSQKENLLVVGNTGSGKTTLLNSLLKPLNQDRIVFIEDTPELGCPNPISTKLLTRQSSQSSLPDVPQQELVKQALRMRPDRIVMGEIRDTEAKDFMQSLATGHKGSMGTLHASHPQQALYRLEMLIQMGAPQWSLQSIRRLIQLSLSYLVVIKKENGTRTLDGIYKITGLESFGFLMESIGEARSLSGNPQR